MGHGKTIQQAWHWPCIGPNQERSPFIPWKFGIKTLSVHSDQARDTWMWRNTVKISQ